jgi:hypothetical protein
VFENRMLRIFGYKREEVAGDWRGMHNEELHNLYASPNIVRVIKSRRTRWLEHVTLVGEIINAYELWTGNLKGRDHSKDLGVDVSIILEGWEGVEWMHLAQDRDQWWALVNKLMNLRVPLKDEEFLD